MLGKTDEVAIDSSHLAVLAEETPQLETVLAEHNGVLNQLTQLEANVKIALIGTLMAQLNTEQLQVVLALGQQYLDKYQRRSPSSDANRQTRLLLKKDYTYQERGLSEPTQYYVYLRRRKPKLDRYIGTLFYLPQGCTLSYNLDEEGRVLFQPPNNVFKLQDTNNAAEVQVVRLICLEPPPADYTFTKQQNDHPEIYLRLEYLDPKTYHFLKEESYLFPFCMHERGQLDRYRWDVSLITLPPALATPQPPTSIESASTELISGAHTSRDPAVQHPSVKVATRSTSTRKIIELPATSTTYFLSNRADATQILERMRLWVSWSERAMPQARWVITQENMTYTLLNHSFKRHILSFSLDNASITLKTSLPVLMKWFQDLGLAVSQTQNQRQYPAAQLKLAHSLFIEMSLSQHDPLIVLKQLFGVSFSKTSLYQ
ncbi:MAG TPA: hypothetical protein V6C65_09950 [Allocoleopsis sp.]